MPKRMTPPNESIGAFQFPWPFGWVSAGFGMIWTKKSWGGGSKGRSQMEYPALAMNSFEKVFSGSLKSRVILPYHRTKVRPEVRPTLVLNPPQPHSFKSPTNTFPKKVYGLCRGLLLADSCPHNTCHLSKATASQFATIQRKIW